MMFLLKNRQELEYLEELASLKNKVREVRLQDNLHKQNYHQNTTKLFNPLTDAIKNTCENLTNTIT